MICRRDDLKGKRLWISASSAAQDGRITSADPADGTPIEVTVRDGAWSWTPSGTVGGSPQSRCTFGLRVSMSMTTSPNLTFIRPVWSWTTRPIP